jgi:tRNA1(Val) A37 N6-methylase TrmN6
MKSQHICWRGSVRKNNPAAALTIERRTSLYHLVQLLIEISDWTPQIAIIQKDAEHWRKFDPIVLVVFRKKTYE